MAGGRWRVLLAMGLLGCGGQEKNDRGTPSEAGSGTDAARGGAAGDVLSQGGGAGGDGAAGRPTGGAIVNGGAGGDGAGGRATGGAIASGGAGASGAGGLATGGVEASAGAGGDGAGGRATGGAEAGGGAGGDGAGPAPLDCAPLEPPVGPVVEVEPSQAPDLPAIVDAAPEGTTIALAPGTYPLTRWLRLSQPGVTLRSTTDHAEDVILDAGYSDAAPEAVVITADDVTLAHVTIQRAIDHPVHVYPSEDGPDLRGTRLYGVRLIDGGEQFLKVNPNGAATAFVDEGTVLCSEFVMTDAGRPHVETLGSGACYTGGIDVHAARGWVVRGNRFSGIYCTNGGLAEHAVHFWRGARDTVIENNVIVDCARGIGLGMGSGTADEVSTRVWSDAPYDGAPLGHVDGVVANNVIWAAIDEFDTGIEIQQARRVTVVHNTVVGAAGIAGFFSSIDYRFTGTDVVLQNNYTRRITSRDGAEGTVSHNVETESLAAFVDPAGGDFHLRATASDAIDQGIDNPLSGLDLDGEPHRNGPPDIGADEY